MISVDQQFDEIFLPDDVDPRQTANEYWQEGRSVLDCPYPRGGTEALIFTAEMQKLWTLNVWRVNGGKNNGI